MVLPSHAYLPHLCKYILYTTCKVYKVKLILDKVMLKIYLRDKPNIKVKT